MRKKAIIIGLKGKTLGVEEKIFLKKYKPWGIILFERNLQTISQSKALVKSVKAIFKDENYPIFIDQEGGRVSRLKNIHDYSKFSQFYFGKLFKNNRKLFFSKYERYIFNLCLNLKNLGININTVPVLDLKYKKAHKIIGDRSFSQDPHVVKKLGNIAINLFEKNKIATVVKHIPGHGLSKIDSHFNLPTINESKKYLTINDFIPFINSKSLFAMTAHVLYKEFDPFNSVTHSRILIESIIRKKLNFKGLLITDDISMKSLKFDLKTNTTKALDAGCNLILHCNSNLKEMYKIAKIAPYTDYFIKNKTSEFLKIIK